MPRNYTLYPEFFSAPSEESPFLTVSFRLPFESRDPIYPASGIQFSFERPEDDREIFLERMTSRDVSMSDSGVCSVRVAQSEVPKFFLKDGMKVDNNILVKLHAWKGEAHLGAWQVGKLDGQDAYIMA